MARKELVLRVYGEGGHALSMETDYVVRDFMRSRASLMGIKQEDFAGISLKTEQVIGRDEPEWTVELRYYMRSGMQEALEGMVNAISIEESLKCKAEVYTKEALRRLG